MSVPHYEAAIQALSVPGLSEENLAKLKSIQMDPGQASKFWAWLQSHQAFFIDALNVVLPLIPYNASFAQLEIELLKKLLGQPLP